MTSSLSSHAIALPAARLRRRALNAKSAKDRHDTAYFAWEVSLRLCVAADPPAQPGKLARATVGVWVGAAKLGDHPLQDEALLGLFARLTEVGLDKRSERRAITPRELIDALPAYRNKVIGHGSARAGSFYEQGGRELLAGLDAAWRAGVFIPPDARTLYVESIALADDGTPRARILDMTGEIVSVLDPLGTFVPPGVLPHRLYLERAGTWRSLHPWIVFDEEGERVCCFNGIARKAEYLDYVSGETVSGKQLEQILPGLEAELRTFFGTGEAESAGTAPAPEIQDDRRFGDYEVIGKLGQGGMGTVYLARQQSLGRLVALKMLPSERVQDPVAVARFQREIAALAKCEHPNVVKILARGEARGTHYYAMEYVEGADLSRVARALSITGDFSSAVSSACEAARGARKELFEGVPDVEKPGVQPGRGLDRYRAVARFFADAARGVEHLHENGILHRDISPGNIMVTWPDERAVVMDLGLAGVENASVSLTKDDRQILGTLRYIAPEQLQKSLLSVDRRADIYSLGATLYELCADRPLFDGETEARLIEQVIREEPPPLDKVAPRVPRDLALIAQKACEKDPKLRYESAADLAADLERFLAGEPVSARPPSIAYLLTRWAAKHKELAAAALTVLVLVVGGLAAFAWFQNEHRQLSEKMAVAESEQRKLAERLAVATSENYTSGAVEDAFVRADMLWPLTPRNTDGLRELVGRARLLVDGSGPTTGLHAWRTELERLGGPNTTRREDPAIQRELEVKRARLCELKWRRYHRFRIGLSKELASDCPDPIIPDPTRYGTSPALLNQFVWSGVGIDRVPSIGERALLMLAHHAKRQALDGDPLLLAQCTDTLAWALFRTGRDREAQTELQSAAELARLAAEIQAGPDEAQETRDGLLDSGVRLEALLLEEGSFEARHALSSVIARAEAEIEQLEKASQLRTLLEARTLGDAKEARRALLTTIVAALERLSDPAIGLLNGHAHPFGWGLIPRLEHASTVAERTVDGRAGAGAWRAAIQAIAAHPSFGGCSFPPQVGLLPLGADPRSGLMEFADDFTGEVPTRDARGELQVKDRTGLVFVLVPGGTFLMGAQVDDASEPDFVDRDEARDQVPRVGIRLEPFLLSKYEMTQGQWLRLTGRNPSRVTHENNKHNALIPLDHPVENVSWVECARWLERAGLGLPTEAQWEYAARAGRTVVRWTGDALDDHEGAANLWDGEEAPVEAPPYLYHCPVGRMRPNDFGLHDLAGNVAEWCRDRYGPYVERAEPRDGERLPTTGEARVLRGGHWQGAPSSIAERSSDVPEFREGVLGVRPMRPIEGMTWNPK